MKQKWTEFDQNVHKVLGDPLTLDDLKDDPDLGNIETPSYNSYEDDDDGAYQQVPNIDDMTPDLQLVCWCQGGAVNKGCCHEWQSKMLQTRAQWDAQRQGTYQSNT